ncbi:MAG: DDE-type integrase/transposase/recombinase [Chloroflexi bacterium]|nr:DDE-type integrase/transposase/recombinase [Chloroflexota bacterium]
MSRNLDVDLTLTALRNPLSLCIPEKHHSDQGIQDAAQAHTDLLKKYSIQISMAAQGKPEENGYAER